jgi:hypothetical protein
MYFSFKVIKGDFLVMLIGCFKFDNGMFDLLFHQIRMIDKQRHEIGGIVIGQGGSALGTTP